MQTHRVRVLDQNSLALHVDLSNFIDLACFAAPDHTNSVSRGEKDVLAAVLLGDGRGVNPRGVNGTKGIGLRSGISLGSNVSLSPVLPASSTCCFDSIDRRLVVLLSHPDVVFAVRQIVSSLGPEDFLLGLLPGRGRPLDDLLHCSGGGSAMAELMLLVNTRNARTENCGRTAP